MNVPSENKLAEYLTQQVSRPRQYSQGDRLFGVDSIGYKNPHLIASIGKLFESKSRAKTKFYNKSELRNPDIQDTVLYRGTVAIADDKNTRDSRVVSSDEKVGTILTDLEILDRGKPGESIDKE